jgi:hypothetical protein
VVVEFEGFVRALGPACMNVSASVGGDRRGCPDGTGAFQQIAT